MHEFIPLLGMVFVLGPLSSWAFSYTPLGRAVVDRLRGRTNRSDDGFLDMQDEIERLHEHIIGQDQRLEEIQERLDFAERMITRGQATPGAADRVATPV